MSQPKTTGRGSTNSFSLSAEVVDHLAKMDIKQWTFVHHLENLD